MRLQKFSGKQKRPRLTLRRVVGSSMSPKLLPGNLVVATGIFNRINAGEVCIFYEGGKEKIKRVERVMKDQIFFIGDNLSQSSDSRQFGWIDVREVVAKVIWPRVHNI